MSDKRFQAILAKNRIARELAEYANGELLLIDVVLADLQCIEEVLGEGNQPSVTDIFENNTDASAPFLM